MGPYYRHDGHGTWSGLKQRVPCVSMPGTRVRLTCASCKTLCEVMIPGEPTPKPVRYQVRCPNCKAINDPQLMPPFCGVPSSSYTKRRVCPWPRPHAHPPCFRHLAKHRRHNLTPSTPMPGLPAGPSSGCTSGEAAQLRASRRCLQSTRNQLRPIASARRASSCATEATAAAVRQ